MAVRRRIAKSDWAGVGGGARLPVITDRTGGSPELSHPKPRSSGLLKNPRDHRRVGYADASGADWPHSGQMACFCIDTIAAPQRGQVMCVRVSEIL